MSESESEIVWILEATGEVVRPETEGAIPLERCDLPEISEGAQGDSHCFLDWYAQERTKLEALINQTKQQMRRRVGSLMARLRFLEFEYGYDAELVARERIAEGAGRYYDTETARYALRWSDRVEVTDETKAIDWLHANGCDEAIKRPEPYVLKNKIPKIVEIPGIRRIRQEKMSIR